MKMMSFRDFSAAWLPAINDRLRLLAVCGSSAPNTINEAILGSLLTRGKRLRPLLTLAVADTLSETRDQILDLACAVEMIHTSSLILDDLPCMDDAVIRRGEPACHRRFGEDIAILAAFGLLNQAYSVVSDAVQGLPQDRYTLPDYLEAMTTSVGVKGMVAGQASDLHPPENIDFDTLEYIHSHKTGALFVACAEIGAMAVQAHKMDLDRIRVFAKNLGLAFQIQDDLLDILSTPEITGKKSLVTRRQTFADLFGIEHCRKALETLFSTAVSALRGIRGDLTLLEELIEYVRSRES